MAIVKVFLAVVAFLPVVLADTPANCTYDDIVGRWVFKVSAGGGDNTLNCSDPGPVDHTVIVDLKFPDVAVDATYGHTGFWTLIYNQGFEVVLNKKKYFAFSKYVKEGKKYKSICDETLPGWSHNVVGTDWACYVGTKNQTKNRPPPEKPVDASKQLYKIDRDLINKINAAQSSWKAGVYPEYEKMTVEEMVRRRGGRASIMASKPSPAPVTEAVRNLAKTLPLSFDWRNVNGQNFVSPVRNQGGCGSCYAFGSMAMYEARLRIATNNTKQLVMSPQDVVSCSEYSQGCEGGFPYLIAGKYAEDFGLVEESCTPYVGEDTPCKKNTCKRYYATDYKYVGGFYGGCNEELMRIQLVKDGPIAVSFEVYPDFQAYKGGIYHHVGLTDRPGYRFNPFEITNHVVLVVGYGADPKTGEKFWVVKNSWGKYWGEQGYFRIRRGTDECAIESIAVETFPIYP
ncbi:dipeptidyl peptidase 1-like isoform X2 [Acanthaster planci]|uniref:Dipeptidyl peptidase 1 n=1 Tax=Acanthaster planci TaxID=133434 RepID=A0A8B7ZGN3_ACAPL|nr:dipeptidyl peptidase 1-like isoform X2 [Acanthaster planci]